MSGFHTATICAVCDPPVVAISTGNGSRCPQCGQVESWSPSKVALVERSDAALSRQIITDVGVRSDTDAFLLAELSRRLLRHAETRAEREKAVRDQEDELAELRDIASLIQDADIAALPPELLAVRLRWVAFNEEADASGNPLSIPPESEGLECPHCAAGDPSVWDDVLDHYAHPAGDKLKFCHNPWRERCRRCSGNVGACACGAPEGA